MTDGLTDVDMVTFEESTEEVRQTWWGGHLGEEHSRKDTCKYPEAGMLASSRE